MENNGNNENIIKNNYMSYIDTSKYKIEELDKETDEENIDLSYKVIVIGDPYVGKTSIVQSLINKDNSLQNYKATIGFDISNYYAKINEKKIRLKLWDTCGLIDFNSVTKNLFHDTSLAIIVFSVDEKDSFTHLTNWINLAKSNSGADLQLIIVGNKIDLERKVTEDDINRFKSENNIDIYIETSVKDNKFVKEVFENVLVLLYEKNKKDENNEEQKREDLTRKSNQNESKSFNLKKEKNKNRNKKKKCNC